MQKKCVNRKENKNWKEKEGKKGDKRKLDKKRSEIG